jgi:RNA polymerase sigma-70 factor (ECF subfamily)
LALWQPTVDELRRAMAGEPQPFERILRAYHEPIYRYLARFVGDDGDIDDLEQEVFLRVARSLGQFEGRSSFSAWVFRIAKHVGLDLLRRRAPGQVSLDAAAGLRIGGAEGVEGFEEADLLRWCITRLSPDLRSALVLRDVLGFHYQEIAEITDAPLSTVKWRIYEARERVQALYRETSGSDIRPVSLGGRLVDGKLA